MNPNPMNPNPPLPHPDDPADPVDLRRRAETRLSERPPTGEPDLPAHETQKLVHELRVYQVELELQNEELRAAEGQYRLLAEFSSEWIFWIDPRGQFRYVSPSVEALTGHVPTDFLDDPGLHLRLIHPEDRPAYQAHLDRHLAHPAADAAELEFRVLHKDGGVRWIAHLCRPMSDAAGTCLGRRGCNRDITERMRAGERVRFSEEKTRLLFENSRDALMTLAPPSWRFAEANAATAHLFGASSVAEFTALAPWQVSPERQPDGRLSGEKAQEMIATAMRAGSHFFEWEHQRLDGTPFAADVLLTRMEVGGETFLQATVRDISERKQAEAQLRKLSLAVEQSPDSIVITGLDACVEYINAAGEQASGYRREELLGRNLRMLQSGKTPRTTYADLWQTLSHGGVWKGEFINRRQDGSEYVEFAIIAPIRQANGRITHYLGIKDDITEKKRLGQELDRHREHLQELVEEKTAALEIATVNAETANRAKSAFLANMSHEIRTPMNAIIGLTHLLKKDAPTPQQAERLDKIDTAAAHLLTIINDILDLSKIEAGKLALEEIDFSLADLFEQIRTMLGAAAAAKGLALTIDRDSVPLWLRGDPTRLRQALLNYAGNAVKFTLQGAVALNALLLEEQGERVRVRFEVRDTGIGIAAETLPELFRTFQQADSSTTRKFGGTGLGLALVRRLARLMQGEAGAESTPGVGSTFWFTAWLARGQAAVIDAAPASATDVETALKQRHGGARLLVVDDEPINQEVAVFLLEDVGFLVDRAGDGRAAVAQAVAHHYDLILMDVQMPLMDGLDATRAIRALPDGNAVPILAMTADAFAETRANCLAAGMNDFVTKPVEPQRMYATLLRWLDQTRGKYGNRQDTH